MGSKVNISKCLRKDSGVAMLEAALLILLLAVVAVPALNALGSLCGDTLQTASEMINADTGQQGQDQCVPSFFHSCP